MKFLKLKMQNFLSWKTLNEFDLQNNGFVFLTGPNGIGKSSLYDAVCWALFGKITKRSMPVEEVVNNKSKKNCHVTITFKIKSNLYEINRYRKHASEKNSVNLSINGSPVSQKRDIQKVIEKIIGMNYETFVQTILFSQADPRYFTQLGETAQRAVLGRLFGFGLFRDAVNRVRERSREVIGEIMEAEGDYNYQKGLIKEVKRSISSLEEKKASLSNSKVSVAGEAKIEERLYLDKEALKSVNSAMNILLKEAEVCDAQTEEYDSSLQRLGAVKKLILLYKSDAKCNACGQVLPDSQSKEFLAKYQKENDTLLKRLKHLEGLELAGKIKILDDKIERLQESRVKLEASIRDNKAILVLAEARREDVTQEIKSKLVTLRKYRIKRVEAKEKLDEARQEALYCDFWEDGFGSKGIENYALNKALPLFNATVNKYLGKMPTTKGLIHVDYSVRNGHLSPDIRYLGSNNYSGVSGGEKRRIDIAVSLALFSLHNIHSNLLCFDEPFDGIEPSAYADIARMLKDFMKENKISTIFVSTQNNDLRAHFQNIWNIGMDSKGNSKLTSKGTGGMEVL